MCHLIWDNCCQLWRKPDAWYLWPGRRMYQVHGAHFYWAHHLHCRFHWPERQQLQLGFLHHKLFVQFGYRVCVCVCHLHIVKNIKSTWTTIITCVEYVNEFRTGSNQPKKATNNVWEHMQKSHNKLLHCIAFYEFSLSYHTIIRAIVSALFTFSFIKITNIATNTIINANKVMPIECVACNALQVELTFDPFIILLKWAQSH